MVSLGESIREARKKLNMTMVELAKKTELTQGYLSKIENNVKIPTHEVLKKFSEILGIPYMNLMEKAGFSPEKSTLEKALYVQGLLIEEMRSIQFQLSMANNELVWWEENREKNDQEIDSSKQIDPANEERVLKLVKSLDFTLTNYMNLYTDLKTNIEDYANPKKDKHSVEGKLKSIIKMIEGRIELEKMFNMTLESSKITSLLSVEEFSILDNFMMNYLSSPTFESENGNSFDAFEEYSLQNGFNLYKTLNRDQVKKVFEINAAVAKDGVNLEAFNHYLEEQELTFSELVAPLRNKKSIDSFISDDHQINIIYTVPSKKIITVDGETRLKHISRTEAVQSFYELENLLNLDGTNFKGRKLSISDINLILSKIEEMKDEFEYQD